MRSLWTDEAMRMYMAQLERHLPGDVEDLAAIGPMEEPLCGVCAVLAPYATREFRFLGKVAAIYVLMYHDEATYEVEAGSDFLLDSGLGGIHVYTRCARVYAEARRLVSSRAL